MKNKLIACLTSGMMLASAIAVSPVQAADKAVSDPVIGTLPDWVPQNFAEALNFYNTHGKSYVADNVICLVRPMVRPDRDVYQFSISGSMTFINTPASSIPHTYELDIPEKPDPDDIEAVKEYEDYCDSLGLYSHDYSFFENYALRKTQYAFEVELFRVLEGYDLTVTWYEQLDSWHEHLDSSYVTKEVFSFENNNGTTAETDTYSWLPDCTPEFNDFMTQYGKASVHDNFIAYCLDIDMSTGDSLSMEQSGEGKIEKASESSCTPFSLEDNDGGASASVILYKPTADGNVNVKWSIGREFSSAPPSDLIYGDYEIKDNCSVINDLNPNRNGSTIFILADKYTGKTISIPDDAYNRFILKETAQSPYTSEIYDILSNPFTVNSINAYDPNCNYSVNLNSAAGRYTDPEFKVVAEYSDHVEVICYLEWVPSGDVNGDKELNVADMVSLQSWLLSKPDSQLLNWAAADFCRDGKIDAFDLCLLKQELIKKTVSYIKPDKDALYGSMFSSLEDYLPMYLGPDESYPLIASIPKGELLREQGYNNGNDNWLLTDYDGHYGWIRMFDEKNNELIVFYEPQADKPVIYLYPEEETDVHVELELTESDLATTYPKYNNGWDVTAYPDGTLLNKADGSHHRYLFWDAVNCRTHFDFSKGFCVAGSDTESFLKEKLSDMGLTESEMNEFIVYWLPRMERNKYNLISFQDEAYTNSAKLHITPTPDSICRVFMTYVPLENEVDIEPQQLTSFDRNGFTVVEWGGCEIVR